MNFAKTETETEPLEFPIAEAEADLSFPDLAEGLHALAQPLSGLRSAVELMNLFPGGDGERYRQMCATEIDRACEMFSCLQGLVSVKTAETKMRTFDCRKLVESLVVEHGLNDRLPSVSPGAKGLEPGMVKGDLERARQAFASLLTVLARVCGTAGMMEASCRQTDQSLVFSFKAEDVSRQRLNSGNRLHLSLARANIVSQGGRFRWQPDPLEIRVALPLA